MAERYARYGLQDNPFEVRPLEPLTRPEDSKRIARLVKFQLDDIDRTLQTNSDAGNPSFFLISGKDGTGRTSVANYILTRYRDISKRTQFIVPELEANHSVEDVFQNWMVRLRTGLRKERINIGDLRQSLYEKATTTTPNLLKSTFQDLALEVSIALEPLHVGFGSYLENIPDLNLLEAAMDIFRYASTVCVMTISESVLANLPKKPLAYIHIALEEIEGAEVWEVIDKRWEGHPPNPFDQNGVVRAFSQKLPIARAIVLTAKLLENKLDYHPNSDKWPDAAELRFDEQLIVSQVNTESAPEWR